MPREITEQPGVQAVVIQALQRAKSLELVSIADDEDVFSKFALNSMEVLSVIVDLERTFGIVIGEEPSEFDRIRSFAGLKQLVSEKILSAAVRQPEGVEE